MQTTSIKLLLNLIEVQMHSVGTQLVLQRKMGPILAHIMHIGSCHAY